MKETISNHQLSLPELKEIFLSAHYEKFKNYEDFQKVWAFFETVLISERLNKKPN